MADLDDFKKEWFSGKEYIVAHTSGSTGKPKEIKLLKADMIASARATNSFFGIDSRSVLGLPLAIDYIAGKMMAVRAFEAKCELYQMPASNKLIINKKIDLLAIVPSQIDSLLEQDPKLVRNVIIGGAKTAADKVSALVQKGYNAYATYGMTETCSHVAMADMQADSELYRAMPGIKFSTDERGCLVIEAPLFSFKRLATNDIVELVDTHSFRWVGRADNVINSGGIKISAEKLEEEISKFYNGKFYITSTPDERWGEAVVMVVDGPETDTSKLMKMLREKLDHRQCPKMIYCISELPTTENGKIIRISMPGLLKTKNNSQ